jgi:hypothetical protein
VAGYSWVSSSSFRRSLETSLLMLNDRIFDSNVDRAMPSLAAVPDGPNIGFCIEQGRREIPSRLREQNQPEEAFQWLDRAVY